MRRGINPVSSSSSPWQRVPGLSWIFRALILVSGLALLPASTTFAQVSASDTGLQSTSWRWMYSVTDDDASVRPVDRDRYTIAFEADGTLSVRADCNQVSGTYRQVGRKLSLQLGPSTQAACPPGSRADVFVQQLGAVVSQVSTDSVLVLNLQQDSGNMLFEPRAPMPLSGTNWQVQSYNNGRGAVTTPLQDSEMTAVFASDGTISGSSGCNSFTGSYSVDGSSLSIGSVTATQQTCSDPVMEQEQAYLTALQASTKYSQTADRLTLRNDDGATQVDFLLATPE